MKKRMWVALCQGDAAEFEVSVVDTSRCHDAQKEGWGWEDNAKHIICQRDDADPNLSEFRRSKLLAKKIVKSLNEGVPLPAEALRELIALGGHD